jgi:DNA-binding CsgD family transcriptional regulator
MFTEFSKQLLELHGPARKRRLDRLMPDAVQALQSLLPLRSAWWGECTAGDTTTSSLNWQHGSLGLPTTFAQEWNAISDGDRFAQASIDALGHVFRDSGYTLDSEEVEQFARRHKLFHAMAITMGLHDSKMRFSVSVYRDESDPAFDDIEALMFGEFCKHLQQIWWEAVQHAVQRAALAGLEGMALCETSGLLVHIGTDIAKMIGKRFPSWSGSRLPQALQPHLSDAPCKLQWGRSSISFTRCGEYVALLLNSTLLHDSLAPRERAVAVLYAGGHSYKTIARRLDLSPATVRTYLRDVYLQLGVRNKIELSKSLGHLSAPSST